MTTTDHHQRLRACAGECGSSIPGHKSFCNDCWTTLPDELRSATHTTNVADNRRAVEVAAAYLGAARDGVIPAGADPGSFVLITELAVELRRVRQRLDVATIACDGSRRTAYELSKVVDAAAEAVGLPKDAPTADVAAAVRALAERAAAAETAVRRSFDAHAELLRKHVVVADLLVLRTDEARELRARLAPATLVGGAG